MSGDSQAAAGTDTLLEGCDSHTQITRRSADGPCSFTAWWIPLYSSTAADFAPFASYLRGKMVCCADCCLLFLKVSHVASELTGQR